MTITFVDSSVLIAAARGTPGVSDRAMAVFDDPARSFASSAFVQLEVLPKALFFKNLAEAQFYRAFFESVSHWPNDTDGLVTRAHHLGARLGLAAMDALHLAAAMMVGADELVTAEKPDKPLHRATDITVSSIHVDK